jgi:hypothetical protein
MELFFDHSFGILKNKILVNPIEVSKISQLR